jgi:hypothetical protein
MSSIHHRDTECTEKDFSFAGRYRQMKTAAPPKADIIFYDCDANESDG